MKLGDPHSEVIDAFAKVCESLNEYAQELRRNEVFPGVTTGADIRYLQSGWQLQKFVEAELNAQEGFWAAWWIELGATDLRWVLSASVSISHSDVYFELEDTEVNTVEELMLLLNTTLARLLNALQEHAGFRDAVARLKA